MNGVFIKSWEVHCAGCERALLGIGRHGSSPDAAEDARLDGWRIRGGKWRCDDCVAAYVKPHAALSAPASDGSK